jgi:hypothetical protein
MSPLLSVACGKSDGATLQPQPQNPNWKQEGKQSQHSGRAGPANQGRRRQNQRMWLRSRPWAASFKEDRPLRCKSFWAYCRRLVHRPKLLDCGWITHPSETIRSRSCPSPPTSPASTNGDDAETVGIPKVTFRTSGSVLTPTEV